MKFKKVFEDSLPHDAAVAAATVIMQEFFPVCPNGLYSAIHERLEEIIESTVESVDAIRWQSRIHPSNN